MKAQFDVKSDSWHFGALACISHRSAAFTPLPGARLPWIERIHSAQASKGRSGLKSALHTLQLSCAHCEESGLGHFSTRSNQVHVPKKELACGLQTRNRPWIRRCLFMMAWLSCLVFQCGLSLLGQTSLSIGNTPGFPGVNVSVPAIVGKATNVVAAQFDVSFDTSKVTAGAASQGGGAPNHFVRSREIAPGVRRVVVYSLSATSGTVSNQGAVAMLPFAVSPTERVSSGPLTPANVLLARRDSRPVQPLALAAGEIFMQSVRREADGLVQFFLPSTPEERYTIQATTDFEQWINLTNVVALGDYLDLVDVDAPNYSHRFYRWALTDALGSFSSMNQLSEGGIELNITGLKDRAYVIMASTNLVDWEAIGSVEATGGTATFVDSRTDGYSQCFYRLKSE
jgi:Cohesin domain